MSFLVNGIQNGYCTGSYGGYTSLKFAGGAFTSSEITSIAIPSTITEIGSGVFAHCYKLKSISLPSTLTKISGSGAFYGTSSLNEIILPDALTLVGQEAFWGSGISSLTIGSNIQSFGSCAFRNCYNLKVINIPSMAAWCQISNGGEKTNPLYYAKGLTLNGEKITDIIIDSSIKEIAPYSFYGFEGLKSIVINQGIGSIGNYAFYGCTGIEELEFPEGLSSIGSYAFYGCKSLKKIMFSSSIINIGSAAFFDCNNIELIESSILEPAETSAFTNSTYLFTPLYVPLGTRDVYKKTTGWDKFNSIIEKNNLSNNSFTLTYFVDGVEYKSYLLDYGATITPEKYPTKEGYTFCGWSEIPATMPAHDVIVTGSFKLHFDVGHVTKAVNLIMKGNATIDDMALYDMNNDGELNIGDVILIVKNILNNSYGNPNQARRRAGEVIDLTQYTAAQFEVKVTADTNIKDIRLVQSMMQTHQMMYQKKDANTYAVVVFSLSNQLMSPENGNIIEIETDNDKLNGLSIGHVIVSKPTGEIESYTGLPIATNIRQIESERGLAEVYDLKGNRISGHIGLTKGVFIVNGKKTIVR